MMTGRIRIAGLLLLVGLLFSGTALAQSYRFQVPECNVQLFVQPSGEVQIVYDITFQNEKWGDPIDVVDIGLPHERFDLSNMVASVDGVLLPDIRTSTYIDTGVEVHLSGQAIQPGERGVLHFECRMPGLIYQDTTRDDYASLQFTPTWFGSKFVDGTTELQIAVHMLDGIEPNEMLYQNEAFTNKAIWKGHAVATWRFEKTHLTGPHKVGISFPKRGLEEVAEVSRWELLELWLLAHPNVLVVGLVGTFLLFSFLFFRFTGGTGCVPYVLFGGGLVVSLFVWPILLFALFPSFGVLAFLNERRIRKRRSEYLPPIAQIEGGGIKRGLTAPEAAVILERPLHQVLGLVIFGLLKKGLARQVGTEPFRVVIDESFVVPDTAQSDDERDRYRRDAAEARDMVIRRYEHPFLTTVQESETRIVSEIDFTKAMEKLIAHTALRVRGFDLSDTQDYYRRIVDRALTEAREAVKGATPERDAVVDQQFEWILLHDDYRDVLETGDYVYRPTWLRAGAETTATGAGLPSDAAGSELSPSLGDVAGSFAGWAESTMGGLADSLSPGIYTHQSGAAIDLSGVDSATSSFFAALADGATSGGGGGGCACACAGCACACACAGGGR